MDTRVDTALDVVAAATHDDEGAQVWP